MSTYKEGPKAGNVPKTHFKSELSSTWALYFRFFLLLFLTFVGKSIALTFSQSIVASWQWNLISNVPGDITAVEIQKLSILLSAIASVAISLRLQGKLSFPYNCQKMNGQIYVLLC